MASAKSDQLETIAAILAGGLKTKTEPFPETAKEFAGILDELRRLDPNDLEGKLVVGGFVDHPYGSDNLRCLECMYYLVHRRWCERSMLSLGI